MTQKIAYARSGDRLSARYLNKIVDGANRAIEVLGPPRSQRLPANDSYEPPLDENGNGTVDGIGTLIFSETSRRTSTVSISDPDTGATVNVERIDEVTLVSSGDTLTLIFTNT